MPPVLEVRDITKRFPGVLANDHISFTLEPGEIHAFLGENGAGKSTLMNILYGLYDPDEGQIFINGKPATITGPNDAIGQGLGMVHQHFMLVPTLTVAENVMLGTEITKGLLLDERTANARIRELSTRYGLEVPPDAMIEDLPVGVQQRVEIIKALYRGADLLILDEPTAVLTPQEADDLFDVMRSLKAQGKSIIFISHKLKEVLAIADRITVLRRGRVVGSADPKTATENELAAMMVGRAVTLTVDKDEAKPGAAVLSISDLVVLDDRRSIAVDHLSLEVKSGEVLGIAGVQGNGQTELVEALTGLRPVVSGHVELLGKDVTGAVPRTVLEAGVAHIPEDRHRHGLVLSYPIADNLVLSSYYHEPFAHGIVTDENAIDANAERLIKEFDVRTPSIRTPASSLSGGNQQKVVIGREFSRPIKLLIAAQPTRGLDVGSIEFIHSNIIRQRDEGAAVLLVSAELDEILALSDRIAVMFKGKINAIVSAAEATRESVGLMMAGVVAEDAVAAPVEDAHVNRA
ncbi:heme ABC transporter ATP-binding protein [Kouleothrix aurantiaca]|jgi:simple sugar transport system ATP-binding protein|uniref:Heme ABC transporter ATP-binding protein n=1 Tax=Kouleothrix aurantiaca TaxID=186479 RepID=A0A0P9DRF8_9CHLR|nr:heme ABC transporter ATP-binding protein [Kouleothrix aurantiaca]